MGLVADLDGPGTAGCPGPVTPAYGVAGTGLP